MRCAVGSFTAAQKWRRLSEIWQSYRSGEAIDLPRLRATSLQMFDVAYGDYMANAYPKDNLNALSCQESARVCGFLLNNNGTWNIVSTSIIFPAAGFCVYDTSSFLRPGSVFMVCSTTERWQCHVQVPCPSWRGTILGVQLSDLRHTAPACGLMLAVSFHALLSAIIKH